MIPRRDFITLLGGAAAWPLAAPAQQRPMPVVGYVYSGSPEPSTQAEFSKGLSEVGFVEGRNVRIESRFAHSDLARLPELAADLVRRRVAVIFATGTQAALAAKAATTAIPIVIGTGADPVETGLVANLNRPGGNVTGFTSVSMEAGPKRLGLLHELVPGAARFAVLVNPNRPAIEHDIKGMQTAASSIGRQIEVLTARTNYEIDMVFASLAQRRADGLLIAPQALFFNRRVQLATLAVKHSVPAIGTARQFTEAGLLMSYGAISMDAIRQAGIYVGRILKGEKPADLPVQQPTKFEFVINLQTAKTIGLTVPPTLLAIATEVIE
jgi:putative ABC transport system substrate-binding protein